jgi:hypothetical protein
VQGRLPQRYMEAFRAYIQSREVVFVSRRSDVILRLNSLILWPCRLVRL